MRSTFERLHGATRSLCLFCFAVVLAGCASINRETHYIKSVDASGYPVNYFRVSVHGFTMLSSSRYLAGFYPDSAVDLYFGQISQPKDGKFIEVKQTTTAESGDAASKTKTETVATSAPPKGTATPAGPPEGTKLVLMLSSRADAVAEEISDIARNEELMRNITKLIYKDELRASRDAEQMQNVTRSRLDALLAIGAASLDKLAETDDADVATNRLLLFANQAAFELGNQTPLGTLADVEAWYKNNRDSLVGRGSR